jgi:hypothetical protein
VIRTPSLGDGMLTEPTAQPRALRHPYSTRGLSLRLLLLGAMLMSLAIAMASGQPVGASSDGREGASGSTSLADGEPVGGPATGEQGTGGRLSGQAGDGPAAASDDGILPTVSASPGSPGSAPTGGAAGEPPDDWHEYHHWTDPSWPDPGQATGEQDDPGQADERQGGGAPLPAHTASAYGLEPPITPTTEPSPSNGGTPSPGEPGDQPSSTPPVTGSPTTTGPGPEAAGPDGEPDTPTAPGSTDGPPGSQGQGQPDGAASPQAGAPPTATEDPLQRDPVAAGPSGGDLGLGDTVDEPSPTPEPGVTGGGSAPLKAAPANATPAGEYQQTLIYSGLIGLALAVTGLAMVGLRRRRW